MTHRPIRYRGRSVAALLATLPLALVAFPAAAQNYPVVQPIPSPASGDLSRALQRLARSPSDFDALVAAGNASIELDDIDAAIGFFSRAETVRAGDPRVRAGLASANLRAGRPIEALAMFDQAQAAGAAPVTIAADRGLAFDLVGNNASAQAQYKLALSQGRNDELLRRLALSQAIAGDTSGFEATLLPMLQQRDLAAYRARAFGLAILGKEDDAIAIVEAVMPRDLADRMSPYLRYMPKLTRAQQAAAANLGNFPRAAQIGRDDPRFAQYAGSATAAPTASVDSRLAPAGEPLGPRARGNRRTGREQVAAAQPAPRKPPVTITRAQDEERPGTLIRRRVNSVAPTPPPPPPAAPPPSPPPAATVQRVELPAVQAPSPAQARPEAQPVVVARLPEQAATGPGFNLEAVKHAQSQGMMTEDLVPAATTVPAAAASNAAIVLPSAQAPEPEPARVADAFAEFGSASVPRTPAVGAVDITAIKPKREVAEPPPPPPPPPPPAKPKAPSRIWVQVATGKDLKALAFDWRRFGKKAPELLGKREAYTTKWGVSQRLLTGPVDSAKAANKLVADLKAAGIDAFAFTSEDGQEIAPLK